MLTFAYPWLSLAALLPLVVWWLFPPYHEQRHAVRVPFLNRLAALLNQEPGRQSAPRARGLFRNLTGLAAWLCLVAALARPQWLDEPVRRTIPVRDMLLAVDLSGSMDTADFTDASGKKISRLSAVHQVLDAFLERRKGDRVGLIVFGSAPFVQAPFTQDLEVCRQLLAETAVGMAGPRTAFGDAIGLAIRVFDRSKVPERILIALTDGNDTGSQMPPQEAARVARDRGIVIETVAIGDPTSAGEEELDERTLKSVAEATGGSYAHASNRGELEAIYDRLDALPTRGVQTLEHRPRRDLFPYPLAAALLLSMLPFTIALGKPFGSGRRLEAAHGQSP